VIKQIKKANPHFKIIELCDALSMPVSSYYYQIKEKPLDAEKERIIVAIKAITEETQSTYG